MSGNVHNTSLSFVTDVFLVRFSLYRPFGVNAPSYATKSYTNNISWMDHIGAIQVQILFEAICAGFRVILRYRPVRGYYLFVII